MDALRIYDYLVLARKRLFDWLRPLTREQYREEHPIGLGSLARTMHHMKASEWGYMERIRGWTEPLGPLANENDPESVGVTLPDFGELEPAWIEQAQRIRADLEAVADWTTPRVYRTVWDEKPYAYRASCNDIFAQLALHEVHHRAQALNMLRRLGGETGELDYNALMWEMIEPE